jgi:hypothetical protein
MKRLYSIIAIIHCSNKNLVKTRLFGFSKYSASFSLLPKITIHFLSYFFL